MKSCCILVLSWTSVAALSLCCAEIAAAQETPAPANTAPTRDAQQAPPATPAALRLTLEDDTCAARKNSTQFQAGLERRLGLPAGTRAWRANHCSQRELQHAKYLFQRQAERCRRCRRCLLRISCGRSVRGSRRFLRRGNLRAAQRKGSNRGPRQNEDATRFHKSRLLAGWETYTRQG